MFILATVRPRFILESNGDSYNCDHYAYPEHKLGNIYYSDIKTPDNKEQAIACQAKGRR
ncbi:hypothetical protein MJ559_01740 [Klebsiella pneumoniae]|nr:hypothetical protein MJ559_01740 [Klebsiella pneumoniae]